MCKIRGCLSACIVLGLIELCVAAIYTYEDVELRRLFPSEFPQDTARRSGSVDAEHLGRYAELKHYFKHPKTRLNSHFEELACYEQGGKKVCEVIEKKPGNKDGLETKKTKRVKSTRHSKKGKKRDSEGIYVKVLKNPKVVKKYVKKVGRRNRNRNEIVEDSSEYEFSDDSKVYVKKKYVEVSTGTSYESGYSGLSGEEITHEIIYTNDDDISDEKRYINSPKKYINRQKERKTYVLNNNKRNLLSARRKNRNNANNTISKNMTITIGEIMEKPTTAKYLKEKFLKERRHIGKDKLVRNYKVREQFNESEISDEEIKSDTEKDTKITISPTFVTKTTTNITSTAKCNTEKNTEKNKHRVLKTKVQDEKSPDEKDCWCGKEHPALSDNNDINPVEESSGLDIILNQNYVTNKANSTSSH